MTRTVAPAIEGTGPAAPRRLDRLAGPTGLALTVVVLTLVVMGLAGAVLAVKLRPAPLPATRVERDLRSWERAVTANPNAAWASTGLGVALLGADRKVDARRAFERALSLDANDWMASFQLGLLVKDADPARADTLFVRAGERAPATSKVAPYVALGDLRLARHDATGARKAYEDAVADSPTIIDARVGLAKALELLGDTKGALDQYREAARFDPSNQAVTDAIARLSRAAG